MNVDRAAFLALTLTLAAVGCAAPSDSEGTASDDITGGLCSRDGDDAASPIAEGTCSAIWDKAQEQDFKRLTTTMEGGKPLHQSLGCTPSETGEFGELVKNPCETFAADFAYNRCHAYAALYKKTAAKEAVSCLQSADLTDSMAVYACGFKALDRSCSNQQTANDTCKRVEAARSASGKPLSAAEKKQCRTQVGGLNAQGREELIATAEGGSFFSLHSALEGLQIGASFEGGPAFEGGPSTEGGPAAEGGPSTEGF